MSKSLHRSFKTIEKADLSLLIDLARECLDQMLARNETGQFYSSDRALMACLCQGAARHFVHGDHGVHDWDVVFFFMYLREAMMQSDCGFNRRVGFLIGPITCVVHQRA